MSRLVWRCWVLLWPLLSCCYGLTHILAAPTSSSGEYLRSILLRSAKFKVKVGKLCKQDFREKGAWDGVRSKIPLLRAQRPFRFQITVTLAESVVGSEIGKGIAAGCEY